jgi:hypothetical protein
LRSTSTKPRDGCGGNAGSFVPSLRIINICDQEPLVLLHELAHTWTQAHLTEQDRSEYVSAGGFESWNDKETVWSRRGSEHAADTIAWSLLEEPIMSWAPDGAIAELNAAYRPSHRWRFPPPGV